MCEVVSMSATGRTWQRNWWCDSGCARERSQRLCTVYSVGLRSRQGRFEDFMGLVIAWRNRRPM
jgi:hypothetical protein